MRNFKPENHNDFENNYKNIGAAATARKYNITLAVALGYAKRNNIKVPKYNGLKNKLKNINEFKKDCETLSQNQLSKKYKVARTVIKRWAKEYNITLTNVFKEWEDKRKNISNNLNFFIDLNKKKDLKTIAEKHNLSIEQLKRVFSENEIDVILHSYNKSKGEIELKNYIKSFDINVNSIKRNFEEERFEIDCFLPEFNLGIEYCGEFWHSDINKNKKYHQNKTAWCQKQNIQLLTIFESEWKYKNNIIKSMIENKIGKSKKIYGRQCIVKEIDSNTSKMFHDENHLHGGLYSSFNYGLFYNNILFSVLSISKNRFNKLTEHEITRFSTKLNCVVIGGFSKLLKFSNHTNLLTFADLRFGNGNVYKKTGFEFVNVTNPNYWYYLKDKPHLGLLSRQRFQKHKLANILENYDSKLTEYENMINHNYLRIWDCGNNKFVLHK